MTAGGQGITLTKASVVAFAELYWTPAYVQCSLYGGCCGVCVWCDVFFTMLRFIVAGRAFTLLRFLRSAAFYCKQRTGLIALGKAEMLISTTCSPKALWTTAFGMLLRATALKEAVNSVKKAVNSVTQR